MAPRACSRPWRGAPVLPARALARTSRRAALARCIGARPWRTARAQEGGPTQFTLGTPGLHAAWARSLGARPWRTAVSRAALARGLGAPPWRACSLARGLGAPQWHAALARGRGAVWCSNALTLGTPGLHAALARSSRAQPWRATLARRLGAQPWRAAAAHSPGEGPPSSLGLALLVRRRAGGGAGRPGIWLRAAAPTRGVELLAVRSPHHKVDGGARTSAPIRRATATTPCSTSSMVIQQSLPVGSASQLCLASRSSPQWLPLGPGAGPPQARQRPGRLTPISAAAHLVLNALTLGTGQGASMLLRLAPGHGCAGPGAEPALSCTMAQTSSA